MNLEIYQENLISAISDIEKLALHKLDTDNKLLKKAFDILYEKDIFTLYKVNPKEHNKYKFILFSTLTKTSGSLAFMAVQILAANAIMLGNEFVAKDSYFRKKSGIAVNHFRASVSLVSATKRFGGYFLNGKLSWASGYGILDSLLIGFHYEDKECQSMVSFSDSEAFRVSEVLHSFVGNSMTTVNIELNNFFVPDINIVSVKPKGSYIAVRSVSHTIHFALYGLGLGAVEVLLDKEVREESSKQLENLKERFLNSNDADNMEELRVELFLLVQQIITTGMVLYGGKSILIEEKMQRYYRELIMFNSNGLNGSMKSLFKEEMLRE